MAARSAAVYGAGAVGSYLGGKLAGCTDLQVTLIGRPGVTEAIQKRGLIIREGDREEVSQPAVATSAEGLAPCDLVLLTVRTYDVESAIPDVRRLMGEKGFLLALQNGIGTEEMLAEELGRSRVLVGTLTVSGGMEQPGVTTRYSKSGGIALASMGGSPPPEWTLDACRATGLPTDVILDYRGLRWSKLLLNMLGAPISAILDMDIGDVMAHPELFRLEQLAFREAGRVMDALGVPVVELPGYPVPMARLTMRLPRPLAQATLGRRIAAARGGRSPAMRADMQRGKTEVGAYNGAIAREAGRSGLSAPVNEALAELTQDLAAHPERRAEFRGKPEVLLAYIRARSARA